MTRSETFIPLPLIGVGSSLNRGAFDWSYEKLVALANGSEVFIIDAKSLEVVQVLSGHKGTVTRVLWLPSGRQFASAESKLSNRDVVSIDSSNQLIIWDTLNGQPVYHFIHPDPSRQILDVRIPNGADLWARTKVYILYSGNMLAIFDHAHSSFQNVSINYPTGDPVGYGDHFIRFSTDPHCANQAVNCIAFLAWDAVSHSISSVAVCNYWDYSKDTRIIIHGRIPLDGKDLSTGAGNFGNSAGGISRSTSGGNLSPSTMNNLDSDRIKRQSGSSSSIRKLVSDIIVGPDYNSSPSHSTMQSSGSIKFHPGMKDFIVASSEMAIYLISTQFMVVLHTLSLDKSASPIVQIIPTKQRSCLMSLHENGTIILRKYGITGTHNVAMALEPVCCNENPRFSGKKTEVLSCALNPLEENSVLMYLSDGRLFKYELLCGGRNKKMVDTKKHLTTPSTPYIRDFGMEDPLNQGLDSVKQPTSPTKLLPLRSLINSILETDTNNLKLKLKRVTNAHGQFTCLKSQGDLLIAGTSLGFLIVLKVVNNRLKPLKKFAIHSSSPVSGIEFVSDSEILTYSNLSFSANPKCELMLTEIWTGASKALKTDDSFHIQAVRVSPLGQYFVITYKSGSAPCELWDLPRRQLIKTLPNKLPPITCIHWRQPVENTKEEVFYMTDLGSFLFTFRVEGNRFLNATCVKLEHTAHVAGVPAALFSNGLFVFRVDCNAVVVMYNTSKKTASPSQAIGRGPLLAITKTPEGNGNYVVQFADNLILWDFVGMKKVKHLHPGKLKTLSVAVCKHWVAYIPKATNGIRMLPLDTDTDVSVRFPVISRPSYAYFMDSSEKASEMLSICRNNEISIDDLLKLARNFGAMEELSLWNVVWSKLNNEGQNNCIDIFSNNPTYKEILVKTAQCVWGCDYRKREEVGKVLLWSGETERAAEILLDTEPSDSKCYVMNGLKACVAVGSSNLPEQSKAVLKIVATNLIACGETDGGLELLCLLQKHNEACKYVESTNEWGKAILLCKTALSGNNSEDSLCKYAQFMNSKKCAFKAASVFCHVGKFDKGIEVLFGARLRHLSFLLLHFCEKQNISLNISDHIRIAIRLDFARFVFECGLQKQAIEFCDSLGESGKDLKQELEILSS